MNADDARNDAAVTGEGQRSPSAIERLGLAEMQVIFDQMHTRMALIAQLMNFSVALAAAAIGAAVTLDKLRESPWAFLLLPAAFYLFAFLTLREDLLLAAHDRYWYQLRYRVAKAAGATRDDLAFLVFIKGWKVGRGFTFLSGLKYVVPAAAASSCIGWAATRLDTKYFYLQTGIASLDVLVLFALIAGVVLLGRRHSENERERLKLDEQLPAADVWSKGA